MILGRPERTIFFRFVADLHGHFYSYNIDRFVCRKKKIGLREEVLQA